SRLIGKYWPAWVCPESCKSKPALAAANTLRGWWASSTEKSCSGAPALALAGSDWCPGARPPAVESDTPATSSLAAPRSRQRCWLISTVGPSASIAAHQAGPSQEYSWLPVTKNEP